MLVYRSVTPIVYLMKLPNVIKVTADISTPFWEQRRAAATKPCESPHLYWLLNRDPYHGLLVVGFNLFEELIVKLDHFPNFRDENQKFVWNQHYQIIFPSLPKPWGKPLDISFILPFFGGISSKGDHCSGDPTTGFPSRNFTSLSAF